MSEIRARAAEAVADASGFGFVAAGTTAAEVWTAIHAMLRVGGYARDITIQIIGGEEIRCVRVPTPACGWRYPAYFGNVRSFTGRLIEARA